MIPLVLVRWIPQPSRPLGMQWSIAPLTGQLSNPDTGWPAPFFPLHPFAAPSTGWPAPYPCTLLCTYTKPYTPRRDDTGWTFRKLPTLPFEYQASPSCKTSCNSLSLSPGRKPGQVMTLDRSRTPAGRCPLPGSWSHPYNFIKIFFTTFTELLYRCPSPCQPKPGMAPFTGPASSLKTSFPGTSPLTRPPLFLL